MKRTATTPVPSLDVDAFGASDAPVEIFAKLKLRL